MAKTVLAVPKGFVKIDGKCFNCEDKKEDSLLVQASGGASCLNCGWTIRQDQIVKDEPKKKAKE